MAKLNCWEGKKCGREVNGTKVHDLGICPAATEKRLDGVHGGVCAGRSCWAVVGTLCHGAVQGHFAKKMASCLACDFYKQVDKEEWPDYLSTTKLLAKLD